MIELSQLRKEFRGRTAVESLSLTVPRGCIFGLLGHNGAGKSTTIGMLLGQVWATSGTASIGGYDVTRHRSQALSRVGAIFEAPVFYDYLSGWRNLEILTNYTASVSRARMTEVLAWVGLEGRARSAVRTYSHGMKARLALAQALLPHPELLILDEPANGLDPEGIHELRRTIRRLHAELGLTILLSSHQLSEVQQICSHVAILDRGRKMFDGPLSSALAAPEWVRLVTDDFPRAVARLVEAGLVRDSAAEDRIALVPGVDTASVARFLVNHGFALHELTPLQSTLEEFYLGLIQSRRQPPVSQ
jgi:ABC-2 type transport system ATP-binding protein